MSEPALARLLIHQYALLCRLPASRSLVPALTALRDQEGPGRRARLEALLAGSLGDAALGELASGSEDWAVALEAPGDEAPPLLLLTCLVCRGGDESPASSLDQLSAAVAAMGAVRDSGLALERPLRLLVCLDAEHHLGSCRSSLLEGDREAVAAIALDGMQPLVVSWSGEGQWDLSLPHQPLLRQARPAGRGRIRPIVVDLDAGEAHDHLPAEATLRLIAPGSTTEELAHEVEAAIAAVSETRPEARYEVAADDDAVVVTAGGDPLPAWRIDERRNALWDMAALARALRVTDPPGGSLADLFDVIIRFDGDPFGARLGLYYEDPVGGPLRIAPTVVHVEGNVATVGLQLYRPPGLAQRDFEARLHEALRRLRLATGRPIVETALALEQPSRVTPDSEPVRQIRAAFEEVTGEPAPAPGGAPRPGLAALLPQAVSLGVGLLADRRPSDELTASLLVELIWSLAATSDPEVQRRARWR